MDVKLRLLIEAVDNASRQLKSVSEQLHGVAASTKEAKDAGKGIGAEGERGLNRMARAADNLKEKLESARKTAQALTKVGLQMSAAGAALIGAVALPVKTAASFERAMSRVLAVTSGARENFDALRLTAAELGRTTRFTAVEAAEGMKFLGQAGFDAQQVIEAIGPSLNLAAAGGLDLAEAADLASNVVQAFNLRVQDLAHATDVLANTATSSNTSVRQLGEAFKFAAPAAAAAGVSLEDASAAMGVLGNAGIQASLAGTTLRGILASLANPTKQARDALDRLGVQIAKDAEGNIDLITTLQRLHDAHLTLADAVTIFRRQGAAGALVLAKYVDQVKSLAEANKKADGSARQMAQTMEDNLIGALIRLKSAAEGLLEVVGRPLLEPLTELVDKVTALTTALAQAAETHQSLVGLVGSLVGGLGGLLLAFGALFTSVGLVLRVFISLGGAWASALGAIPRLIAGLRGLRAVLNSTAVATNVLARGFVALNAAIGVINIIRATKAFLDMRKAMKEAEEATSRMVESSQRMQARFSEFKDFEVPKDFMKLPQERLNELRDRLAKARVYYVALKNELEEKAKQRSFFGFGGLTEEAKAAKKQLEDVDKKLKEINDFFRAVGGQASEAIKEEVAALDERAAQIEAQRKADIEATAAAEAIKLSIMEDSIEKIELEKQRALEKARTKYAGASPEAQAKLEAAITEKYEKMKADLRERMLKEDLQRRQQYNSQMLQLMRQETDAYLAELQQQLEEGGITEEEFFARKRERITAFYNEQLSQIKEQIKNAVDPKAIPALRVKLQLKTAEMENALRELSTEEETYHSNRVAMERNADLEILRLRRETLGPEQYAESAALELEMIRVQNEQKLEEFKKLTNDKAKIKEMELLLDQQYSQRQLELEQQVAQKRLAIHRTSANLIGGIFGDLYEATAQKVKAFFYLQKAAAVAEAIIQANLAATKAMGQTGIFGIPMSTLIYAQAMARVAMITAQTLRGFAEGGLVRGKKGRDKIIARLSDEEYVMRPEAVRAYGVQFMEALNRRLIKIEDMSLPRLRVTTPRQPAFAGGGAVSKRSLGSGGQEEGASLNIINVVDPSQLDQYLASAAGQNAILNVISSRAETIRRMLI